MIGLLPQRLGRVLCIGAHGDDIEIGCGATLAMLADRAVPPVIDWLVMAADGVRADEVRRAAAELCGGALGEVRVWAGRDGYLPYEATRTKDAFRDLTADLTPDLIFTHRRADRHQDHGLLAELTWQTFRNHLILEYEIPKFEGDLAPMPCFVPVTAAAAQRKIAVLLAVYGSQRSKYWFSEDLFLAVLRLRGMEARAESGLAEAFEAPKLLLTP